MQPLITCCCHFNNKNIYIQLENHELICIDNITLTTVESEFENRSHVQSHSGPNTLTVSAMFVHSVPLTDTTNSSGTSNSDTSLSAEFLLNPAARALLALAYVLSMHDASRFLTTTFTLTT